MRQSAGEVFSFFLERPAPLLTRRNFAFSGWPGGCHGRSPGHIDLTKFCLRTKNNSFYNAVGACYPS